MKSKRENPIPKVKKKLVEELTDLIKNKKTILISSIKSLPTSQFQEIGKKLRGKAIIKVPKKNLIFRAIDSSGNEAIKEFKKQIKEDVAFLFSDEDCFELAGELIKRKQPAKAKAGQEAPEDIEVQAGPTELVPGPAISELGAVGIKIQIENGKITIKEPKIIAKEGEKISQAASDIMAKLDIKPFSIGFIPVCAFDTQEGKLYLNIKIDTEETLKNMKEVFGRALAFAVDRIYTCEDTIRFLLGKANSQANKINRIMTGEPEPTAEVVQESSEQTETPKEKKEETKVDATAGLAGLFG
ncbi:50S ribosomal protein L10 [Candidatus Pacearchaeota archaeon]|nr:50S ribosomal protein L10 [Candidatus Pacearchaeota archaeon]